MREKIERYARGEFEEQLPKLVLPKEPLSWEMDADSEFRGKLKFYSENGVRVRGYAITTDGNCKLSPHQFFGKNVKLEFIFQSKNTAPGDRKRGKIILITNAGEFMIPYEVKIRKDQSEEGESFHA